MFNIFVNGIVETLQDENSDPVLIGNTSINTLLYADDLVLLSSSPQGLQNCLENLSVFCASWKLEVNISKSKALIFNSNGKSFSNHFYCISPISCVSHDLLFLKPCWNLVNTLLFSKCFITLETIICSINLQRMQVSETGL